MRVIGAALFVFGGMLAFVGLLNSQVALCRIPFWLGVLGMSIFMLPWTILACWLFNPKGTFSWRSVGVLKEVLKRLLKQIQYGAPTVEVIDHPIFGKIELGGFREESWEGEVEVGSQHITIFVNTENSAPPSDAQIAFFKTIIGDPDSAFSKAAPLLIPFYESIYGPYTDPWHDTFKLAGIGVPLMGDEKNPWMLQFETPKHRVDLFTVHFRDGKVSEVGYDS